MKYQPHDYQRFAQRKIEEQNAVGLLLEMGLGIVWKDYNYPVGHRKPDV